MFFKSYCVVLAGDYLYNINLMMLTLSFERLEKLRGSKSAHVFCNDYFEKSKRLVQIHGSLTETIAHTVNSDTEMW